MKWSGSVALLLGLALAAPLQAREQSGIVLPPMPPTARPFFGGRIAPNKLSAKAALALMKAEHDRIWLGAHYVVHKQAVELFAQHQDELERGLRFSKILQGDPAKKQIALTFDDGPHRLYTPRILAILHKYHVRATFFVVGEQAEKYPQLVRAEIAAGDSVGNHTYDHVSLVKISNEYIATEIKACGEVLREVTGKAPRLFRPPGGEYDPRVAMTAEALGYTMVLWTDDPADYASPGKQVILSRTLSKAGNGGIILVHDGIEQTIDVLPQLITTLQKRGYQFVTIDQMLAERHKKQ